MKKRRNTDFIWFFIIAAGVFVLMFFVLTPREPIPTVLVLAAVTSLYILIAERKTRRMARSQSAARRKTSAHPKHRLSRRRDAEFGKVIEFPGKKASR